jgi:hypothetical protein
MTEGPLDGEADEPAPPPLEPAAPPLEPLVPPAFVAAAIAPEPPLTAPALEPVAGPGQPVGPPRPPIPPLATARGLLGASFELLTGSNQDMRRASFYIGAIVLGTAGPAALASWAIQVVSYDLGGDVFFEANETGTVGLAFLFALAFVGIVVAAVESRTLAASVLGGAMAGRPVTTRQALARSRMTFWRAIVASIIVAVPIAVVQGVIGELLANLTGPSQEISVVTSTLVTAIVGAPFAYVLAGVVLGDVDPFEGLRRSIHVFRARKMAAAIVAGFETVTALLIVIGLEAGLDIILRVLSALGLGVDSGPFGLAIVTMLIVASVFAFGTLLFTVYALTIAPQVVMFVGLTHATNGLDRVRPGGSNDPDDRSLSVRRFRWLTRPMVLGFVLGGIGLGAVVAIYTA